MTTLTEIGELNRGDWFRAGGGYCIVVQIPCRAHPKSVQCIQIPGAVPKCFRRETIVDAVDKVSIYESP